VCSTSKVVYVFAGSELSKYMLLVDTFERLQYPPIPARMWIVKDVGHRSPDLAALATDIHVHWTIIPSASSWTRLSLLLFVRNRPLRYLKTRPRPDNSSVKMRAASAKLASRLQGILLMLSRLSCNVVPFLCQQTLLCLYAMLRVQSNKRYRHTS
jgi:hypothetical protein